ncbi:MAG: histidine kinase dimerization/phosphoacceptor domain -containing protein [Gracilimonas sp.]|nr:histidine kinase dimerization/phosphoacceptor domain -containing protein [Gracilimonas sp.]
MRLGTKIIIGFICISLLLAFIGIISDHVTSDIRKEQLRQVNEASEVVIFTSEMERSLFQSLIFLNGIREAIAVEDQYEKVQELPAAVEMIAQFDEELEQFERSVENLKQIFDTEDQLSENVNELLESYQVYKSISTEWLSLGDEKNAQTNQMFINSIEPYFRNNIIPEITEVRRTVLSIQETQNRRLESSLNRAALINYIATLLSVLLAIGLAIFIYRSIADPISRVSATAKKFGEGHLDERIELASKDEIGELAEAFNAMAESLQKSTVSKAYLDNIIESIQEALFVADKEGKLVRVNSAATELLGYEKKEMTGAFIDKFFGRRKKDVEDMNASKLNHSFEFTLRQSDGNPVPVLFSEAKLYDNHGEFVGTVSVARDISDRKKAEEEIRSSLREKEVMLAEIHHRVKNNLAVISGLIQLQSFNTENIEVEKALTDSQLRIQSIALVHEMLYESDSLASIKYNKYINDLLQAIQSMHMNDGKNINLSAEVAPLSLNINQAIPFSLLLNEIIVNAYKYGFKNGEEGNIHVMVSQKNSFINLQISDLEKGFIIDEFEKNHALAMSLIETLVKQLHGKFEIQPSTAGKGIIFNVEFKIEK